MMPFSCQVCDHSQGTVVAGADKNFAASLATVGCDALCEIHH